MVENSKIQWTDHTFNPWIGCTKVSPGCTNCYAETQRKRFGHDEWGHGKPRTRTSAANWRKPLAWDKAAAAAGVRHRVFCASLADWLDPEVPAEWLADLLGLIDATPNLDWLLLTKRPELWRDRLKHVAAMATTDGEPAEGALLADYWLGGDPPPHVWIGATVEDQKRADERIPHLLSIPARVRFLSCEPLLESVDLWPSFSVADHDGELSGPRVKLDGSPSIDWVIVGGESGPRARPFDIAWARSIVAQCREAVVAAFVKQLGSRPQSYVMTVSATDHYGNHEDDGRVQMLRLRDSRGGDWGEWPEDLRVREFPV